MGRLSEFVVSALIVALSIAVVSRAVSQDSDPGRQAALLAVRMKASAEAVLLYADDNDGRFPPTMSIEATDDRFWQVLASPYTGLKHLTTFVNPLRRPPLAPNIAFKSAQYFAMPPAAQTSGDQTVRSQGFFRIQSALLTAGTPVRFSGLGGYAAISPMENWYGGLPAASLSLADVADPDAMVLVVESSNWDLWWPVTFNPIASCHKWTAVGGESAYSSYPGMWGFSGPTASVDPIGRKTGVSISCATTNGKTSLVTVSGRYVLEDFRTQVLERAQLPDGTWVFPRFWPAGTSASAASDASAWGAEEPVRVGP